MAGLHASTLTNFAILVTIPRSFLAPAVTVGFTVVCVIAVAVAVVATVRQKAVSRNPKPSDSRS